MRTGLITIVYAIVGLATIGFAMRGMVDAGINPNLAVPIGIAVFFGFVRLIDP